MDSIPHLSVILLEFRRKTKGSQTANVTTARRRRWRRGKGPMVAMEATKQVHNKTATTSKRSSRASKNE